MNEREARRINTSRHEAILAHDSLHETIRELRSRNADLLSALRLCLPVMSAHTEASHLIEGFARRENRNDRILNLVKDAILKEGKQ
jgi:hypothetical protein